MAGSLPDGPSARSRQILFHGYPVQVRAPLVGRADHIDGVDADQQDDLDRHGGDLALGCGGERDVGLDVVVDPDRGGARLGCGVADGQRVLAARVSEYTWKTDRAGVADVV